MPSDPSSDRRQNGSGPAGVKWVTGRAVVNDQALHGKWATDRADTDQLRNGRTIGTWNVRGLLQPGKLHIIERELMRLNINICGLSETHWKSRGHFTTENHMVYIAGAENTGRNGVAFLVNRKLSQYVESYRSINERLMTLTLNTKPYKLHLIQVYMSTTDGNDQEIEDLYNIVENTMAFLKPKGIVIVLRDFNSKVGRTTSDDHLQDIVGRYGLGERNERGNRLMQFATDNNLSIMNTMFKHHPRRLYTWTSPNGQCKNQIDYILADKRWRTSFRNVKTRPSAECGSDHKLLWANFKIKLSKPISKTKTKRISAPEPIIFQEALRNSGPPQLEGGSDQMWRSAEKWITETADSIPKSSNKAKYQHWISDETLALIEKRRAIRTSGTAPEKEQLIKNINNKIKSSCRRDKNIHIDRICAELERHSTENHSTELYRKVRYLAREFKPRTQIIKDNEGNVITDAKGIAGVWRTYCTELFQGDLKSDLGDLSEELEPSILREEVEQAMRKLRNQKAPGCDGITAEVLKNMGEFGIPIIHSICQKIWTSGIWPKQWCHSIFLPLYKKGSPLDCGNYRMIALIPHASKIMLGILNERLKNFLLRQIPDEQTGFVPGKGTREQILNVRQIIEKTRELNVNYRTIGKLLTG